MNTIKLIQGFDPQEVFNIIHTLSRACSHYPKLPEKGQY